MIIDVWAQHATSRMLAHPMLDSLKCWRRGDGVLAASVAAAQDRLVGIGSVDLTSPRQAVLEVRRVVRTLGFKGIRALPWLCKALEGLDGLALGADVEQAFLAGNAQRVFSITH